MYQIIDIDEDNAETYERFLSRDLAENFGRAYYRGILARNDDNEPVGGMVWCLKNYEKDEDTESSIIWIRCEEEDVFSEMMDAYTERIREDGVLRSQVSIPVKNGKELKARLRDSGFQMRLTESDIIIVKLSELTSMPLMKKMKKMQIPEDILPLNQLSLRTFRRGIAKCIDKGRFGLCEDLSELGISWFEDMVSCVSTVDGAINGFFLFHKRPSGVLAVQLLICLDKSFKTTLPLMMKQFVVAMEENYPPDTLIELDRHNEQSMLLTERLLPRGFGIPIYAGSREEA